MPHTYYLEIPAPVLKICYQRTVVGDAFVILSTPPADFLSLL